MSSRAKNYMGSENQFQEFDRSQQMSMAQQQQPQSEAFESLGFYPAFLRQNFPGIKYAIAHGSFVFPVEKVGQAVAHIPNSASRLLDLILVVPDDQLPDTEPIRIGDGDGQWNMFNSVTRTSAQFHGGHRSRFPEHYMSKRLREMDEMELAKLQRLPASPVLYFPLIRLPRAGNQSRDLWCKYGIVAETDLINDLLKWDSFHLAGRAHKPFLSFDPSRDISASTELCHSPPDSLAKALATNRVRAVQAALLLLPEKFTFGTLLYTIISLSYMGDIRFPFAESKDKVTKLLHSLSLPLSDVYLNLLMSTPGLVNPNPQKKIEGSKESAAAKADQPKQPTETQSEDKAREGQEAAKTATGAARQEAMQNILTFANIPGGIGDKIGKDVLLLLAKYHQELAGNARERLTEIGTGVNPDRVDPIRAEMRELKEELFSEDFVIKQDTSDKVRQQLFASLPSVFKESAEDSSASVRFNRLFNPLSLLSQKRLTTSLGHPLPWDHVSVLNAMHQLGRASSISTAKKALRVSGFVKCAQYTMQKISRRLA